MYYFIQGISNNNFLIPAMLFLQLNMISKSNSTVK